MKNNLLYIMLIVMLLFTASCGETDLNDPKGNTAIPAKVSNPRVKNINGASIIYYDRPDDKNLKYVKAVYTTDDGVKMDATASFYTDSLLIEGFGTAGNYTVNLFSVSTGETYSEPVPVTISPLEPPYLTAIDSLELFPTFAGIRVATNNITKAKLSIGTYKKNAAGEWEEIGMHYTTLDNIGFSVRGQDTIEAEYGARVRDRWGHWSEMKTLKATPWYEMQCNRNLFKEVQNLNTDTKEQHTWSGSATAFTRLWDDRIMLSAAQCFHTKPSGTSLPQHFTMDLGKAYTLSRIKIWPRGSITDMGASGNDYQHIWTGGHPKQIRLYGSTELEIIDSLKNDINDPSWVFLGEYYLTRADGSLDPLVGSSIGTADDKAKVMAGFEFEFPADAPKLRFFRFQTVDTYGGGSAVMLDELQFFGSDR